MSCTGNTISRGEGETKATDYITETGESFRNKERKQVWVLLKSPYHFRLGFVNILGHFILSLHETCHFSLLLLLVSDEMDVSMTEEEMLRKISRYENTRLLHRITVTINRTPSIVKVPIGFIFTKKLSTPLVKFQWALDELSNKFAAISLFLLSNGHPSNKHLYCRLQNRTADFRIFSKTFDEYRVINVVLSVYFELRNEDVSVYFWTIF